MAYALPDILLFVMLLLVLWLALFALARWWVGRGRRRESDQLIRQIENGLNQERKNRKGG